MGHHVIQMQNNFMKYILSCFLCISIVGLHAQYDHEGVFPELDGDDLREALLEEYKPSVVLTYSQARDTFFRNIDAVDNVLECVYTGYKITLDPLLDPTIDAFSKGINTEHTYPRSKGAFENTNAYSDMHHLFPTREQVNSDRGSLPFSEITDAQTDKWYLEEDVTMSIPSQEIERYSELWEGESFEPREAHKGDVARSYFYFYTMYQNQADQAAPNFFSIQQETMCQWHYEDPVDEKEWNRNIKISAYQDGKKNPFILDCRLARLYCDEILGSCLTVSVHEPNPTDFSIHPNPAREILFVELSEDLYDQYQIITIDGKIVGTGSLDEESSQTTIDIQGLAGGFYTLRIFNSIEKYSTFKKFVKQ